MSYDEDNQQLMGETTSQRAGVLEAIKAAAIGDQVYPQSKAMANMTIHSVTVFGNHAAIATQPVVIVWLPQRVLELRRCFRIAGSAKVWDTLNGTTQTPSGNTGGQAGVPLIGDPPANASGSFVPGNMRVTMNSADWFCTCVPDQNLSLKPDIQDQFPYGFPIGGLIKIKSDATNNTSNTLSGVFSYGCLSTVNASNLNFSPPNLVQESVSKKSAALNVPCYEGIVSVSACDMSDETKPFKISQNTGLLNSNSRRFSDIWKQTSIKPTFVTAGGGYDEEDNSWNDVQPGSCAWISPFSVGAFGSTASSSTAYSFVGAPCSMFDVPAFDFLVNIFVIGSNANTTVSLAQGQIGTVRVIHYFFQTAYVTATTSIGGNWIAVQDNLPVNVPASAPRDPRFVDGPYGSVSTAGGAQKPFNNGFGVQRLQSIPQLPDGYQWFGTYVHACESVGSETRRFTYNIVQCDQYLQNDFEKGRNGPMRVIRGDNLAVGQNINVSGTIWFAAEAGKAVAPYVQSGPDSLLDVHPMGTFEFIQRLYDTPDVDAFKRIMTESEFNATVAALGSATPDVMERYLQRVVEKSKHARAAYANFFSSLPGFIGKYGRKALEMAQTYGPRVIELAPRAMDLLSRAQGLADGNVMDSIRRDGRSLIRDALSVINDARDAYRASGTSQVIFDSSEMETPDELGVMSADDYDALSGDGLPCVYELEEPEDSLSASTLDPFFTKYTSANTGKPISRFARYGPDKVKEYPGIFVTPRAIWKLFAKYTDIPASTARAMLPLVYMEDKNRRKYLAPRDVQNQSNPGVGDVISQLFTSQGRLAQQSYQKRIDNAATNYGKDSEEYVRQERFGRGIRNQAARNANYWNSGISDAQMSKIMSDYYAKRHIDPTLQYPKNRTFQPGTWGGKMSAISVVRLAQNLGVFGRDAPIDTVIGLIKGYHQKGMQAQLLNQIESFLSSAVKNGHLPASILTRNFDDELKSALAQVAEPDWPPSGEVKAIIPSGTLPTPAFRRRAVHDRHRAAFNPQAMQQLLQQNSAVSGPRRMQPTMESDMRHMIGAKRGAQRGRDEDMLGPPIQKNYTGGGFPYLQQQQIAGY